MRDDPVSIPPLPLKIITTALIALFVILPVIALVSLGQIASIPLIVLSGLTLVGVLLGLMFLHRIVLWIHYRFYWYIMAGAYVCLIICASLYILPLVTPLQINTISRLPIWTQSLFVPGAFVGIVAIVLAFRHRRLPSPRIDPLPNSPPAPSPAPPNPKRKILDTAQQLATRKANLGLSDKDDANK